MMEFTCKGCGCNAGSSNAQYVAVGLCMNCSDDAKWPERPLCGTCGMHKVTCNQAAFDRGVRVCRLCSYQNTVDAAQLEYQPVFDVVEDFYDCRYYVEQTGGMTMVAYIYLEAERFGRGGCEFCGMEIKSDGDGNWMDAADGDRCNGAYDGTNANGVHAPGSNYPCIGMVHDQDMIWGIGFQYHQEDHEGFYLDTSDLLSGTDEKGNPTYDGVTCATAEQVAERVLLLIENPEYGRL